MTTNNIIKIVFELCILPILGILTKWLVNFIQNKIAETNAKTNNELTQKYLTMFGNTVTQCVLATNQTYVEALKKEGKFDLEAQKKAFEMTKDAILMILQGEVLDYISEIISDLDTYIDEQIEANVNMYKNN